MTMRPWRRTLCRCLRQGGRGSTGRPWEVRLHTVSPVLLTLAVGVALAALCIGLLEARLRPMVVTVAQTQAKNALSSVIEGAVVSDLAGRDMTYGDFIQIQRDAGGAITALTTDMASMNLLRASLVTDVLNALDGVDVSDIRIPLGSLLDLDVLWAKGPCLRVHSMTVGTVDAEFSSEFSSAGVNQTLHRLWLQVDVPLTLILPGGPVETRLETRLCVAETVIVGQVPDTYLQLSPG